MAHPLARAAGTPPSPLPSPPQPAPSAPVHLATSLVATATAPILSPYPPPGPAPSASAAPVATSTPQVSDKERIQQLERTQKELCGSLDALLHIIEKQKNQLAQCKCNREVLTCYSAHQTRSGPTALKEQGTAPTVTSATSAVNPSSASSSASSSSASSSSAAPATALSATLPSQASGNSLMEELASKLRELRSLWDDAWRLLRLSSRISAKMARSFETALRNLEGEIPRDLARNPSAHVSSGASSAARTTQTANSSASSSAGASSAAAATNQPAPAHLPIAQSDTISVFEENLDDFISYFCRFNYPDYANMNAKIIEISRQLSGLKNELKRLNRGCVIS